MSRAAMNRWNARRDSNEKPIVDALEAVGAIVFRVSGKGCPDLLVGYKGTWTPLEVKGPKGKLTKTQQATMDRCPFTVVTTIELALQMACGISWGVYRGEHGETRGQRVRNKTVNDR